MAWLSQFPTSSDVRRQAEKAYHVQLGLASPLWLAFGAAASAGAAWWWATRLTRATNLEALLNSSIPVLPGVALIVETLAEADAEADPIETVEAAPEAVVAEEPAVEAAPEPTVAEAPLVEAAPEPADVEAPVAEIAPEPAELAPVLAADDDLTRLVGVGPKVAKALAERGVTRFAQLAAWTAEDLARFDAELKLLGRGARDAWIAQAKRLASES